MTSSPKLPVTPQPEEETPIGDIDDMIADRISALGSYDDDDEEDSPIELDLGAFLDPEPLAALLEAAVSSEAEAAAAAAAVLESADALPAARAESEDELPSMDEDWGMENDKKEDLPLDDGREGPDQDAPLDLEAELRGSDSSADSDYEILELSHDEAAEQLDMELAEEEPDPEARPVVDAPASLLLDSAFLGPRQARGCAAAFPGGKPIVVGEGMFVFAADGLLHETAGSTRLAVAEANSVVVQGRSIFVGTDHGGLFVTRDMGLSFEALNNWVSQGLFEASDQSVNSVPTSLRVFGQQTPRGYRLLGLTGEGQLLTTLAPEREWSGPYKLGRCQAVCPVAGTDEVLIVSGTADEGTRLLATPDFDRIAVRRLPPGVEALVGSAPILLSASAATVLCGVNAHGQSVHLSEDSGQTWRTLSHLGHPTALLVDPDNPLCLTIASWREHHGMGALHHSTDGGLSFCTVLATGEYASFGVQPAPFAHQIRHLSVHLGRTRRLLVVTDAGTYMLALGQPRSAH